MFCRFAEDDVFRSGRWPVIASSDSWSREKWPMPEFLADASAVTGQRFASTYSEDDPARLLRFRELTPDEQAPYPPDNLYGGPNLEHHIGEALGAPRVEDELDERAVPKGVALFVSVPRSAVETARRELYGLGFTDVDLVSERASVVSLAAFMEGSVAELRSTVGELEKRVEDLVHRLGGEYEARELALG